MYRLLFDSSRYELPIQRNSMQSYIFCHEKCGQRSFPFTLGMISLQETCILLNGAGTKNILASQYLLK